MVLLHRSIDEPIRELSTDARWSGDDRGLIWCWERGRQKRAEQPDLAKRAAAGELVPLAWRGGVDGNAREEMKRGTLHYLATWQGLRGEDLSIDLEREIVVTCEASGQVVVFGSEIVESSSE